MTLLPPIERLRKPIWIGLNYRVHAEEQGKEPTEPGCWRTALV